MRPKRLVNTIYPGSIMKATISKPHLGGFDSFTQTLSSSLSSGNIEISGISYGGIRNRENDFLNKYF